MVFYLKDAHVRVRCNHAPICKFVYSVTKNDKVDNWSQDIHAITPYIDFEHIKGRDNILVESISRLKTLGLYKANDPNGQEVNMANLFFDTCSETICDFDINQHSSKELEIKGIKYLIDEKHLDNFPSQSTDAHSRDPNPSSFKGNLDM